MPDPLPLAPSWAHVVEHLVAEMGSLAEVARRLQEAAPPAGRVSSDPTTVERGLRRLRTREHAEGDKYGRLVLRVFGVPLPLAAWARALGQYHSRLSDLAVPVRADQLRLWDRPPIAESRVAAWIHVGVASLAHRINDLDQVRHRLDLARRTLPGAEVAARLEWTLFEARLSPSPEPLLEAAEDALQGVTDPSDRACYQARLADQRAYRAARTGPRRGRHDRAAAHYAGIPDDGPPFARFRRAHGLAWCAWRQGRSEPARRWAARAVEAAGDGGLLRFRVMALTLSARVGGSPGALDRALSIATALHDEELADRVRGEIRAQRQSR